MDIITPAGGLETPPTITTIGKKGLPDRCDTRRHSVGGGCPQGGGATVENPETATSDTKLEYTGRPSKTRIVRPA